MKRDDDMVKAIKAAARQIPKDIKAGLMPPEAFGMTDNASPRPWRPGRTDIESFDAYGDPFANIYADSEKATPAVAAGIPVLVARVYGGDARAKAALIVKAVNSHAVLVEALEAALAEYKQREWTDPASGGPAAKMRDALALARGEAK